MRKTAGIMLALLLLVPALASAWTLQGTVQGPSGAGQITVNTTPAKVITGGTSYASVAAGADAVVTLTPAGSNTVSKVVIDGVIQGSVASPVTIANTGASHSIVVTFAVPTYTVTTAKVGNGTVTIQQTAPTLSGASQTSLTGIKPGATFKATATPATDRKVTSITYGATTVPFAGGAGVSQVVTGIAINADTTFTANFALVPNYSLVLKTPGNTVVGTAVTLDASSSTSNNSGLNFAFAVTGCGSFSQAASATPTFTYTPSAAGTCSATLTATSAGDATGATKTATITVLTAGAANNSACTSCHTQNSSTLITAFDNNAVFQAAGVSCQSCHSDTPHTGTAQAGSYVPAAHVFDGKGITCAECHYSPDAASGHGGQFGVGCVDCHAVNLQVSGNYVNDNNGVRAIMPEFAKRSHHITGGTPTNAQCVVCHLEGKVVGTAVVVDGTKHVVDNKIHLRNADDNSDFAWDGTNHSTMDNFCFSCHDSNGALAVPATFAGVASFTGNAANPFGDTLKNGYDQVARPGVVDVKTAFTTTNASHHAVSGQRYTYRFSTLANAEAWAARTGNPVPAASEIAEGHTVDGVANPFGTGETYDPAGPEEGGEATLYEAGKFVATYIPLGATQNVADNSTLHCGDCHTVGQWKVGSSTSADGNVTPVAIGAHGSANEYLLRNSEGTDAIHNGRTYVCFNCHSASTPTNQEANTQALWDELVAEGHINSSTAVTTSYTNSNGLNPVVVPQNIPATVVPTWKAGWNALHPTIIAGAIKGYATAHAVSAMHIQCEADSADNITSVPNRGFNNFSSNRLQRSWAPQTVKAYDYSPAPGATAAAPVGGSNAGSGNITGIACTNCHNSGLRNGWGGIHGGDNTYTDGLGRTQKSYRFMPGMGNYRYAPPGGWDGKDVSDATLLTATNPLQNNGPANGSGSAGFPGASGKPMGGCYTNGGTGAAGSDLNNSGGVTYGVCNHHGTSTAKPVAGAPYSTTTVTGNAVSFRATYGGGTTGSPTTYEPTVREATAGGTLVTRPLKY